MSLKPPRSTPPRRPRMRTRGQRAARGIAALALAAIMLASLAVAPPAEAAVVHWKSTQVEYAAEGKDVKDVLRDFAASQGVQPWARSADASICRLSASSTLSRQRSASFGTTTAPCWTLSLPPT